MAHGEPVIKSYLDEKYLNRSNDDDGRFKDERGEYHASRVGSCPRQWAWKFQKGNESTSSPYFELGDYFETIYGDALRAEYGSDRVVQDVECEIQYSGFHITGESDWVVLTPDAEITPETVFLDNATGTRRVMPADGDETQPYQNEIDHVIETKTIKKAAWVDRYGDSRDYIYQLSTYMLAFDCPGQLSYMERNDLSERVKPYERDEFREMDLQLRAKRQHDALDDDNDDIPPAAPPKDKTCDWCQYKDECQEVGGRRWGE